MALEATGADPLPLLAPAPSAPLHLPPPAEVLSLELIDGRMLDYTLLGAPLQTAKLVCMYHHGVPASLVEAEPLGAAGGVLGVAVVAFDRSGMGGSTFNPGMTVASVADDASQLMDHLGLSSCVHIGESGGAPFAAAFAAAHPRRTQQVLLLAGLAATHGSENAKLLGGLNGMDRLSIKLSNSRLGVGWTINRIVKLVADVSGWGGGGEGQWLAGQWASGRAGGGQMG